MTCRSSFQSQWEGLRGALPMTKRSISAPCACESCFDITLQHIHQRQHLSDLNAVVEQVLKEMLVTKRLCGALFQLRKPEQNAQNALGGKPLVQDVEPKACWPLLATSAARKCRNCCRRRQQQEAADSKRGHQPWHRSLNKQ